MNIPPLLLVLLIGFALCLGLFVRLRLFKPETTDQSVPFWKSVALEFAAGLLGMAVGLWLSKHVGLQPSDFYLRRIIAIVVTLMFVLPVRWWSLRGRWR